MKYLSLSVPGYSNITGPSGIPTGGLGTTETIIRNSVVFILVIAALYSLFVILLAGIAWIMSGGDKAKVQAARAKLTYAIIGFIVSLLSFFIVSLIGSMFGITFF
jgi:hypothetical protein